MKYNQTHTSPTSIFALLAYAAVTFWLSWFLMPDPGTTDAAHILSIVKQHRDSVLVSVLIQITSSVAYLAALFLLVARVAPRKTAMTGIILFGVGLLGLCSDAFFHLLAYFMTGDTVTIQADVVEVMRLMQTAGVVVLVPILLPFFIGSLVMAIGFARQGATTRWPALIFSAAFVIGIFGTILVTKVLGLESRGVALVALSLFSIGHAWIGVELGRAPSHSARFRHLAVVSG